MPNGRAHRRCTAVTALSGVRWPGQIIKSFMFEFINNYFVLFYISYLEPFKQNLEDRTPGSQVRKTPSWPRSWANFSPL